MSKNERRDKKINLAQQEKPPHGARDAEFSLDLINREARKAKAGVDTGKKNIMDE